MTQSIRKMRSAVRGNLGVMIVTRGLWTVASNLTAPFLALYVLELGGSYVNIGEMFALGAVVKVVPGFLGGYLSDRMGRKRIVYVTTYLLASLSLIRAFAPDYRFLVLAAALEAVFMGFQEPSLNSLVGDSTDPDNRAMGFALQLVGPQVVGILSPGVIGVFMDLYGLRAAMTWGYVAMFVLGSLAALIRQRSLEETLKVSEEAGGVLPSAGSLMSGFRETLASLSGPLKIFLFVDFIFTFALGLGDPYYVTFAIEGVGLSASQWGITTTLTLLVNCAVLLLVAAPSDDLGRMRFVLASMISWPITYLLYVNSTSFTWVLVTRIAVTLSAAVGQPAWTALFVDFCPREHRGRFNALAMVAWSLLYGGGNYLGGVLIEGHGVSAPFLVAAALMSIGALIAVFTLKEPQKREE